MATQKLYEIKKAWKFRSEKSVLSFATAVLLDSEDNSTIGCIKNGKLTGFKPISDLLVESVQDISGIDNGKK